MKINEFVLKALSPILYGLGFYQRNWKNKAKTKACVAVVYYHRVVESNKVNDGLLSDEAGISAEAFEKHMRFMLKHFTPIKPSEVNDVLDKPGLYFAVTFDDGFEDNYTIAAPILSKLGLSGAFFVVSDFINTDKLFWWEQLAVVLKNTNSTKLDLSLINLDWLSEHKLENQLSLETGEQKNAAQIKIAAILRHSSPSQIQQFMPALSQQLGVELKINGRSHPLMTWQQLDDLQNRGFDIGGHTATHANLGTCKPEDYENEILNATVTLKKGLNKDVPTFAYPYGTFSHYTDEATQTVIDAGYQCAFTTNKGIVTSDSNTFRLPRVTLHNSKPFACAFNIARAFQAK